MTVLVTIVGIVVMPVAIGYVYMIKRGAYHRPEYDMIG